MASQITEDELKKSIKGLITSTTNQTTIRTLERDFLEMIGNKIPFRRFGYNSVEHLLKSIPDTCVVEGTGPFARIFLVHSQKSGHMDALVSRQRVNTKRRGRPTQRRYRAPAPMPPRFRGGYQNLNYSMSPNTSYSSESSCSYQTQDQTGSVALKLMAYANSPNSQMNNMNYNTNQNVQSRITTENHAFNRPINNQNIQIKNTTEINAARNTQPQQNGSGTQLNKEKSNDLNKTKPDDLTKEKHNFTFVKTEPTNHIESVTTKADLRNTRTSEYTRRVDLWVTNTCQTPVSEELIEPFEMLTVTNGETETKPELSEFDKTKEDMSGDTSSVPNKVQERLRDLISKFPEGIWVSELPKHYQKMFRRELVYINYGYTGLIEMCVALKHIFHYSRPGKDDFKLYDKSKPLPDAAKKLYTMASFDNGQKDMSKRVHEALPELDWSDFQGHIPEDICRLGRTIPRQFLPEDVMVETVMDVVVVEAYDPSKFWIYLGTSQEDTELDHLMDDLQSFYGDQDTARKYAIPSGLIKENLYCVQKVYDDYHRGLIVQVYREEEHVKIFCIDYGSTVKVPMRRLCFLHNRFSEVPAQAIRCSLANIVPTVKGHPWPNTTKDRFRELINGRATKINISHIDHEELLVYVFLADVSKPENIVYINHVLVREKHAQWDKQEQDTPLLLTNLTSKVQNLHLFPTHAELEQGLAPSVTEIYSFDDMLVPLNFYLPQYFTFNNQDQLSHNTEQIAKQIDPSFTKTVSTKHYTRNFANWTIALTNVHKPVKNDLKLFNDLEETITDFYKSTMETGQRTIIDERLTGDILSEEELFCDVEDDVLPENRSPRNVKYSKEELLNISDCDKELPNNILTKLTDYKLLDPACSNQDDAKNSTNQLFDGQLPNILELSEEDAKTSSESRPSSVRRPRSYSESKSVTDPFEDVNIFDNPEAFKDGTNYMTDDISIATPFGIFHHVETSSATSSGSTNLIKFDSDYSCDSLEKGTTTSLTDLSNKNLPEAVVVKRPTDSILDATVDEFKAINEYRNTNPYENWMYSEQLSDTNPFKHFLRNSPVPNEKPALVQEKVESEERSPTPSAPFSSAVSLVSDESDYKSFDVPIPDRPKSVVTVPPESLCTTSRLDAEHGSGDQSPDNMSSVSMKSSLTATAAEFKPMYQQQPQYHQWSGGHYHPQQHCFPQQQFYPQPQVAQCSGMMNNGVYPQPPLMSPPSNPYGMARPHPRPPPGFHYPAAYYQQQQQMQSFASFMTHQMNSAPHPAMYSGYYNGQHLMSPNSPLLSALSASQRKDFYDFHNEQLLKQKQNSAHK